jgi:SAM-dependent methyltransferase
MPESIAADEIAKAFWVLLGRAIAPLELRDQARTFDPADPGAFHARLISSPEFRLIYQGWTSGHPEHHRDLAVLEAGLRGCGRDESFIAETYRCVLGRDPDAVGAAGLLTELGAGASRAQIVGSLLRSSEFERRYAEISPEGGFVPRDTQLCELANPAKWDNPEWMRLLRDLAVLPDHKLSMHRKSYEFTQLVYGLSRLNRVRDDATVLSVGAGHESPLYWLANRVRAVVATDLYEGNWQSVQSQEGDPSVLRRPEDYAPFPYRTERLRFLRMDGLHLAFRAHTFDVAYSLSSIEHFGGLAGAVAAVDEMARVVKPGGLLVVATEYLLSGPPHEEVFTPDQVRLLANRPGLRPVAPIDEHVYARYEYVPINLYGNPHQTPHMVVRMGDSVFTTAMLFLAKDDRA